MTHPALPIGSTVQLQLHDDNLGGDNWSVGPRYRGVLVSYDTAGVLIQCTGVLHAGRTTWNEEGGQLRLVPWTSVRYLDVLP